MLDDCCLRIWLPSGYLLVVCLFVVWFVWLFRFDAVVLVCVGLVFMLVSGCGVFWCVVDMVWCLICKFKFGV